MDSESLVDVGAGTPLLERMAYKWGRLFVYLLHEEHRLQQKQPQQQNNLKKKKIIGKQFFDQQPTEGVRY